MKTKNRKVTWRKAREVMEGVTNIENPDKYWWRKDDYHNIYHTAGLMTNDEYNDKILHTTPKFYQAELRKLSHKEVKVLTKGAGLAERMGDAYAMCPYCGKNEWWLLPVKTLAVREGGKAYCECLSCGYQTHL